MANIGYQGIRVFRLKADQPSAEEIRDWVIRVLYPIWSRMGFVLGIGIVVVTFVVLGVVFRDKPNNARHLKYFIRRVRLWRKTDTETETQPSFKAWFDYVHHSFERILKRSRRTSLA